MFVNVNNSHPSLLFVGKAGNLLLLEWPPYKALLGQAALFASLDFSDTL